MLLHGQLHAALRHADEQAYVFLLAQHLPPQLIAGRAHRQGQGARRNKSRQKAVLLEASDGRRECALLAAGNGSTAAASGAISVRAGDPDGAQDRKSTRLNSSHLVISYAVFCLKKKKYDQNRVELATHASTQAQKKR